jgi:histidine ammonia-lyase
MSPVVLDGHSLTLEELVRVARDPAVEVAWTDAAAERVERGRRQIEAIVERYQADRAEAGDSLDGIVLDYGVTTGFGSFKNVAIEPAELERLQRNILLSHCAGVGAGTDPDDPESYFTPEVVRSALLLRLNTFLKGHSGVRLEVVAAIAAMLHRGIVPLVPTRGSVGSSGDLCPLAHLFVVLLGEGRYYVVGSPEDLVVARRSPERWKPAAGLAGDLGLEPPEPSFKEGLALTNGATFSAAMLALAVHDAEVLVKTADVAVAFSLEAVCGCARAFDPKVHQARGLAGQIDCAANVRALLAGSRLLETSGEVQDVYSLRCAPAVHGASRDAVSFARRIVESEMNAATDNPLFFPGPGAGEDHAAEPWDFEFRANWEGTGYSGEGRCSYSAGNFHGQPVGLAADYLACALAEIADVSERRTSLLLDHHYNRGLPPNLVAKPGVNSGFMLAQYTSAALVSENKVLCHPSSVDSIPTSGNSEDHVAMSTTAGRKLLTVLANSQAVVAIELLVAAQAADWRALRGAPASKGAAAQEAPAAGDGRSLVAAAETEAARFREAVAKDGGPAAADLAAGTRAAYEAVRGRGGALPGVAPLIEDRVLDADVREVRRLVVSGRLLERVERALGRPLRGSRRLTFAAEPDRP